MLTRMRTRMQGRAAMGISGATHSVTQTGANESVLRQNVVHACDPNLEVICGQRSGLMKNGMSYIELGVRCLHVVQSRLGGENAQQLDVLDWKHYERLVRIVLYEYPPGIPQSKSIERAALAVPPVAISGSRR